MKNKRKNLYFDIKTEVKLRRDWAKLYKAVPKHLRHKVTESMVARMAVRKFTMDDMLVELRENMKNADFIDDFNKL